MYSVVFITAGKKAEARKIAKALLKEKLVACVNVVSGIESFFWWKGKIDRAQEVLLIAKTKSTNIPKIIKKVKSVHSYDLPEIIALGITAGYAPYLKWIDESLR